MSATTAPLRRHERMAISPAEPIGSRPSSGVRSPRTAARPLPRGGEASPPSEPRAEVVAGGEPAARAERLALRSLRFAADASRRSRANEHTRRDLPPASHAERARRHEHAAVARPPEAPRRVAGALRRQDPRAPLPPPRAPAPDPLTVDPHGVARGLGRHGLRAHDRRGIRHFLEGARGRRRERRPRQLRPAAPSRDRHRDSERDRPVHR